LKLCFKCRCPNEESHINQTSCSLECESHNINVRAYTSFTVVVARASRPRRCIPVLEKQGHSYLWTLVQTFSCKRAFFLKEFFSVKQRSYYYETVCPNLLVLWYLVLATTAATCGRSKRQSVYSTRRLNYSKWSY
jgi:hypothetical protein